MQIISAWIFARKINNILTTFIDSYTDTDKSNSFYHLKAFKSYLKNVLIGKQISKILLIVGQAESGKTVFMRKFADTCKIFYPTADPNMLKPKSTLGRIDDAHLRTLKYGDELFHMDIRGNATDIIKTFHHLDQPAS